MAMEAQRVVVIQDASRDVSWKTIKSVLQRLKLKPNDELTLVGVLHQVYNPMGYKSKVDVTNPKLVEEEVARKEKEYHQNTEAMELLNQCELQKIKFRIEVQAGSTPKVVAVNAAERLEATWIVLDRQMKKDKRYFLDELSCGIWRMKRNNHIEKLREPKAIEGTKPHAEKIYVTYSEMMPESPKMGENPQKSPTSQKTGNSMSKSSSTENPRKLSVFKSLSSDHLLTSVSISSKLNTEASSSTLKSGLKSPSESLVEEIIINTEQLSSEENSPFSTIDPLELPDTRYGDWVENHNSEAVHENYVCSGCKNRRPTVSWMKEFKYEELYAATKGFSPKNFLSEGGFGSVYKGKLKNGLTVAVKQRNDASFQGEKEFKSEVEVLSKTRHKNLVMLLGSCSEGNHRLLVYEFVCNGSLDQHLSKHRGKTLRWERRVKIALGAAKGLEYLHRNNIIHRDVRPNNILVTHDHEPLLGDFGLARTQSEDADNSEGKVVGTLGYLAPEYVEYGRASTKSDVYSFGMVLLQLITGLRPTDKIQSEKSLIGWARPLLKEKNYPDLIDKRISDSHDMHQLFWTVQVAENCLLEDPKKRWTMARVVEVFNKMIEGNMLNSCTNDFSQSQSDEVFSEINSMESVGVDADFSVKATSDESTVQETGRIVGSIEENLKAAKSQKQKQVFYDEMVV